MDRRSLLIRAGAMALLPGLGPACARPGPPGGAFGAAAFRRVGPSDAGWPAAASWERLSRQVGGRLIAVRLPLAVCAADPRGAACAEVFTRLRNPYYLGDEVTLTQTLGWVDASTRGWPARPPRRWRRRVIP